MDPLASPGTVIDDSCPVSVVEAGWRHRSSVILDVDYIHEVDTLRFDVIVLPDPGVYPMERHAVVHDGGVVFIGNTVGSLAEERS